MFLQERSDSPSLQGDLLRTIEIEGALNDKIIEELKKPVTWALDIQKEFQTVTGVSIKRIVDGKIVQSWAVYDFLDFYKQLGVIEYKEFPWESNG